MLSEEELKIAALRDRLSHIQLTRHKERPDSKLHKISQERKPVYNTPVVWPLLLTLCALTLTLHYAVPSMGSMSFPDVQEKLLVLFILYFIMTQYGL